MANGTDSKEKLLAKVRPGLKREFEFAFRVHSEICGGSSVMGRTRSSRSQGESPLWNFTPKRSKVITNGTDGGLIRSKKAVAEVKGGGEEKEEEEEIGVVELGNGDEEEKRVVVESVAVSGLVSGGIVLGLGRVEERTDLGVKVVDEENVVGEGSGGLEGVLVEVNGGLVLGLGNVERKSELDVEENENAEEEGCGGSMTVDVGNVGGEGSDVLIVVDEGNVGGEGNGGVEEVSLLVNGGLVLGLGDVEMKSEVDVTEGKKENVCGVVSSGLMAVSGLVSDRILLGLGNLEKKDEFEVEVIDKGAEKSDSDVKEDDKGDEEKKSGTMVKEDDKGNIDARSDFAVKDVDNAGVCKEGSACEEKTSGSSSVSILVDGGVVTGFSAYSCPNVEEIPFRRFTRSVVKVKMEMEEESSAKCGVEIVSGSMGDAKVDSLASSAANATATATSKNMSHIISRNGVRKSFSPKLKGFLDSGILEGVKVKYLRGSKAKALGEAGLQGVIQGSDILCFCGQCKGKEVVTPTVFELHAGSPNKRPPEYIHLVNGNTLRDVMNTCKNSAIQNLDEAVRISSGCSSLRKSKFCFNCRGSMVASEKSMLVCNKCLGMKQSQVSSPERTDVKIVKFPQEYEVGKTNIKNIQPPQEKRVERTEIMGSSPEQPVVQGTSGRIVKSSASRSKSQGKLTRKDLRLHKLVFEEDILPDGTEVAYYARGKKLLMGYKKGYGIVCSCCDSEVSPSQFEAHAGWASRRKPYLHIYTSNGVSLHELSISLCKSRKFSTQENDDLCQICQDGGDLICCDGCPRSFHKECLHLSIVPKGEFYCKFCLNAHQQENCVEHNANAIAAGRVVGVDPIDQISRRCIRIVKVPGADFGGCALCRDPDFEKGFGPRTVLLCDQCEREFHVGCLRDHKIADLKELPTGKWFCCSECNRIHLALQKLVFHGEERLPDSNVDVIKKKFEESGSEICAGIDVRWRLLSGRLDPADSEGLLSAAIAIFHEQFTPIAAEHAHKGDRDLIPRMVKGENIMEHDFGGMYCAVLLVNHVIVSAAIIRIFGPEVAELPLIATSSKCQGKALFNCIEKLLGFLDVKNLVLPAVEESESIWTNKFGFNQMTQDQLLEFRRFYGLMVFQGSTWLHKSVPKCRIVGTSEGG